MTEHILSPDCPCGPSVETVGPSPTQRQMRTWLRQNRPDLAVGSRGFLSAEARSAYVEGTRQA